MRKRKPVLDLTFYKTAYLRELAYSVKRELAWRRQGHNTAKRREKVLASGGCLEMATRWDR